MIHRQGYPVALIRYHGTDIIDYKKIHAKLVKRKIVGQRLTCQIVLAHFQSVQGRKETERSVLHLGLQSSNRQGRNVEERAQGQARGKGEELKALR